MGDGATVISDRLVASWTSRANSESESEITIAAICAQSRVSKKREADQNHYPVRYTTAARYFCIRV